MDEQQNKAWKVGDLKLSPTQQNSGVVVKRAGSAHAPDTTLAAFTTPAEMIAWLAKQYEVDVKPQGTVLHISAGRLNAGGGKPLLRGTTFDKVRVDEDVEVKLRADPVFRRDDLGCPRRQDAKQDAKQEPRYQWKTRSDFVAALTAAICLVKSGGWAGGAPAAQARLIADKLELLKCGGIGE